MESPKIPPTKFHVLLLNFVIDLYPITKIRAQITIFSPESKTELIELVVMYKYRPFQFCFNIFKVKK